MALYSSQDASSGVHYYYAHIDGKPEIIELKWKGNIEGIPDMGTRFHNRNNILLQLATGLTGNYKHAEHNRMQTLLALGGQGKTTLALMAAKRFHHKFPGGI